DVLLDRGRDVPQVAAWTGIVDSYVQGLLGDLQQAGSLGRDLAGAHGDAHVGPESFQDEPQVEADQVALGHLAVAWDAVDGLVVDRDADRAGEPVVAEEARGRAPISDQPVGDPVQLDGLDARPAGLPEGGQGGREQAARAGHEVDFVLGLENDHAVLLFWVRWPLAAARTWRLISSIVPRPSISETRPPTR